MAKITRINPDDISKPFSNYSHVVTAEGVQKLVFCAGQVAADADGRVLPPDDFDAQAKMVMANLTKALAAGGAKITDVTKIIFRRSPTEQHTLYFARTRQPQFPPRDRSDRCGVTVSIRWPSVLGSGGR